MKRLADKVVRAGVQTFDDMLCAFARRHEDHVDVAGALSLANFATKLDAVHVRHLPIGNHHPKDARPECLERLAPIAGRADLVASARNRGAQELEGNFVIVDDEHPHGRSP